MSILSRLQSQVTGREIDVSPTGQTARIARQGREAIQGSVSNAFRAILPTAEESSSVQAVQTPILTGTDRQRQLESYAQLADDRRRIALETELYQLTQPGRVYNEETTARNRARVQEIENELSTLRPRQSNSRLRSGVQSILSSALGALPAVGETVAQVGRNANAQANDPEYQSLSQRYSQLVGRMEGLERSYRGHEDYLYATEEWNALAREREKVLASLRARGTAFDNPVDVNSEGMRLIRESAQYQQQALEGLEGVPRFLGETALSIGQNAALLPTAAIHPAAPLAAMGTISAANRMYELSERGLSASEALGRGLISGGIEAATEKIPLENLLSVVRTGGSSALRNVLRQAGIEAGEESVSYLANYIADRAAQDPEAEFSLQELARSAAGGALSGGVFGGAAMGINALTSPRQTTVPTQTGQTATPSGVEAGAQTTEAAPTLRPNQVLLPTEPGQVTVLPRGEMSGAQQNGALTQTQEIQAAANVQTENQTGRGLGTQIPVEERTWEDASNRRVNAFQYDHPELRPYYAEAAQALRNELASGTRGERFAIRDQDGYITGYTGTSRSQSSPIEQALDNANLSYADIDRALTAIINDQGQENYAAAKKMELVLDDMLSNGYTGADGHVYGPNDAYLSARESVNRGLPADSTDYRMSEEEWASLLAQDSLDLSSRSGQVYERSGDGASLSAPVEGDILNPGAGPQYLTGPESSVGGAREGFDPWSQFQLSKSEFFPEGANAARPVDVPTTDPQGRLVRRTASTAMGAKAIPDEAVADIQNMVLQGELSYDRVTDKASIDRAIKTIEEKTYAGALEEFRSAVSKGVVSKDIATLGQQLLINAANAGDEKITAGMLSLYAQMETTAGQAVQAASILRKLSPTSQLYAAQRTVSELEKTIRKNNENRENHMKLLTRKESQQVLNTVTDQGETALRLLTNIIELYAKQTPNKRTDLKTLVDRNPDFETYADDIDSFIKSEEESGWVSQLGMELARNASRRATDSTYTSPTFYQTILSDLTHFMENYVDKRPKTAAKRTAANRLTDYFQNRSEYTRAWIAAQSALREQYKESPFMLDRLEDFLLNGIDYNAVGPDQIVGRAVADAAINEDVDLQKLLVRWNYDKDALVLQISSNLIQETGAEGADAIMIHDAVARHIYERVSNSGKDIQKLIDYNIRKSMKEIGVKLPNLIKEGKGNQKSTADTISNMLVQKYGISNEAAETFSNEVTKRFFAMVETSAHKKLEYMFKDKPQAKRRNIMERFTELVNLGAFLDPDFDAKAAQKLFGEVKIRIDSKLIERFSQQTDQAGRDKVLEEIYQNVADQIPANWMDKWNAWRYLAMLANPRTHVRNVAGNFFFQPLRIVKDRVAAAIEAGVSAAGGGKLQRTKSFLISPELYRAAWSDWFSVRDVLSGNKYDDIRSEINSRRRIFRFAPLEAARTGNSWLLEFEDSIFKRITYADALAGYLQANGVTAEQMRNNTVDAQVMSRARDYAAQEALRATYQDRNAVSNKVVEVARVLGPAGEAILPFKRTPANILVRGMEYSPAGLAKALTADLVQVRRGNMTGAEAIDHIASGLTGSALFALGAYLFAHGIVTSGGGDDENEDRFNELTGSQNYALNLPDGTNVTLDWLAPEALPFFMGVELMDSMGQSGNTADSIMTALKSISDPMLELSMLQSLNDVIDSVSFSENKLGAMAASSVISYFTQAIPTIGGQIERSGEDVRMSTYTDKNLALPTDIQYAIGRASARIPGVDYQQIPYIDAWGREESSGPTLLRMGNNFLNPAYTSRTEVTPVDEEIRLLYNRTGDGGVVPDRPPRYITVDGERVDLTAEQYVQYATDRGQMQFRMLEDLFDRPEYNALSSTDRAALVNDVYEYADKVTKAEISDYELDGWVKTAAESGVDPEDYLIFRAMTANITGDKDENGDTISGSKKEKMLAAIDMMDLSVQEKDALYYAIGYSESTLRSAPWH